MPHPAVVPAANAVATMYAEPSEPAKPEHAPHRPPSRAERARRRRTLKCLHRVMRCAERYAATHAAPGATTLELAQLAQRYLLTYERLSVAGLGRAA